MTTKVSSAMQDLTDDYAFSGTVSGAGKIVQVVNTQTGTMATGTTAAAVYDNTSALITEGDEYMTLAITPTSATNKLMIDVVFQYAHSVATIHFWAALFNTDSHATDALATGYEVTEAGGQAKIIGFRHYMTAFGTSATTFRVRAGGSTGATTTFNGRSGTAVFNGAIPSSITITEIQV